MLFARYSQLFYTFATRKITKQSRRRHFRTLLEIIEALCSFLQAENLRNFQELQRTSETFFLVNGHKENDIVASRVSVELL